MTSKNKIKNFFQTNRDDKEYIEEYEKHITFFNNLLHEGKQEEVEFALQIKIYNYIFPLGRKGFYKKALKELNGIENYLEKIRTHSIHYKLYEEACIFQKGLCLGRLKRYKESNFEFASLLKKYPNNDNYIDWYKSNRNNIIQRFFNTIMLIGFGLYILIIVLEIANIEIEFLSKIKIYALLAGLISLILPDIIKRIFERRNIIMKK